MNQETKSGKVINSKDYLAQMNRLLDHAAFRGSKRCSAMLRYLVEHSIIMNAETLKERTIGVEVFDRPLDYDTASDPIVRMAASDIRKRIAQYYHEPGHEIEPRIDIPAGSYVVEFRESDEVVAPSERSSLFIYKNRNLTRLLAVSLLVLVLCALSFIKLRTHKHSTSIDQFWSPILESSEQPLLCATVVGGDSEEESIPKDAPVNGLKQIVESPLGFPIVTLNDTKALLKITQYIDSKKMKYKFRGASFGKAFSKKNVLLPGLDDLRSGPIVFIGNSDWTMQLLQGLRFHLQSRGDTAPEGAKLWIEDSQNPSSSNWSVRPNQVYREYSEDYAIISRIYDSTTGRVILTIGGLGPYGTAAAAEYLTDPDSLNAIAASDSPEWKHKNVQIILSTKIIGKMWTSPKLLAKYFW